jgi:threonine/homoserine/homoserine lactone efflux protein
MLFLGFRFGMLLQFAVGPVCLFIFSTATRAGFATALLGVCGVVLGDALYILLAIFGVGALMKKGAGAATAMRLGGALVLFLFGLSGVIGAFGASPLPQLLPNAAGNNTFAAALLLTLSNPLSILFWSGVFTAQVQKQGLQRRDALVYGLGSALATAAFLSLTALLGNAAASLFTPKVIGFANAVVGCALMALGVRCALGAKSTQRKAV